MKNSISLTYSHNSKSSKEIYLYTALFCGYYLQGVIYPSGGNPLAQAFLFAILMWGAVCMIREMFFKNKPLFINLMTFFIVMLLITYIVSPKEVIGSNFEKIGRVSTFGQFKDSCGFCLSFFIGCQIARKDSKKNNSFVSVSIALMALAVARYYVSLTTLTTAQLLNGTTNNTAYEFIALLPVFAMTFKRNKALALALFFVATFFVILCAKRGAIVCLGVSLIYIFYWYRKQFKLTSAQKIGLVIIILAFAGFSVYEYFQNEYLIERMESMERHGIGTREVGYPYMFNHWLHDPNPFTFLFGNGTAQTVSVWGNFGHNDWLELLIDNGVFGVVVYALLIGSGFYYVIKKIRDPYLKLPAFLCMLIWFLETIFSMGYPSTYSGIQTFILGYVIILSMKKIKKHSNYNVLH